MSFTTAAPADWRQGARQKLMSLRGAMLAASAVYRDLNDQINAVRRRIEDQHKFIEQTRSGPAIAQQDRALVLRQLKDAEAEIQRLNRLATDLEQQRGQAERAASPAARLYREAERIALDAGIINISEKVG